MRQVDYTASLGEQLDQMLYPHECVTCGHLGEDHEFPSENGRCRNGDAHLCPCSGFQWDLVDRELVAS